MRGRPRAGLPGATVTTLTPAAAGASDGMSRNWPCARPTAERGVSVAGSRPPRSASVTARTAPAGPSAATAAASRNLTAARTRGRAGRAGRRRIRARRCGGRWSVVARAPRRHPATPRSIASPYGSSCCVDASGRVHTTSLRSDREDRGVSVQGAVLGFGLVALLLTITPGLDTALVLRAAITRGRRDAVATALGVVVGVLAWGAAAAVGVSALLTASTVAYDVLRLVGAGYLVWLGGGILGRLVRPPAEAVAGSAPSPGGAWRSARTGLLTNLLNPKVGAFYLSVLPQFLPPDTSALGDRKSTRLNSSHANISYAVFCLKKKKL